MPERQKLKRATPAHKRIAGSKALANAWSDAPVSVVTPDPEEDESVFDGDFDEVLDSVLEKTPRHLMPVPVRKRAAREQRQKAETPATQAASEIASEELEAQAQASVAQMTPQEMRALKEALIMRQVEEDTEPAEATEDEEYDWNQLAQWEEADQLNQFASVFDEQSEAEEEAEEPEEAEA